MAQTWTARVPRGATCVCTGNETPVSPAKATVTVAFSSAVAGNTVTLHGLTFTATAADGDNTGTNFAVGSGGSANTTTGDNFVSALARNRSITGCTGVNASGTVTVTADVYGTEGHYAITKVGAPITLGAAALAGGVSPRGINCKDVGAILAKVYATTSTATIATGTWVWYHWDPTTNLTLPIPALNETGPSATRGIVLGSSSPGLGVPVLFPDGYMYPLPVGVTVSADTVSIDLQAFEIGAGQAGRTM